jgi:hypothetical protein
MFEHGTEKQPILKESSDLDQMPEIATEFSCGECGLPASVVESDSNHWANAQGHIMHRMRVILKCGNCKTRTAFRLGGYVVRNSDHVKGPLEGE